MRYASVCPILIAFLFQFTGYNQWKVTPRAASSVLAASVSAPPRLAVVTAQPQVAPLPIPAARYPGVKPKSERYARASVPAAAPPLHRRCLSVDTTLKILPLAPLRPRNEELPVIVISSK